MPLALFRVALFACFMALACAPALAEKRIALVVGNGAYAHANTLANPPNDASDMIAALKANGFDVVSSLDAGKAKLDQALRTFTERLTGADVALFFYAGHGLQVGQENYIVPVDAKLERDLEFEAVRLNFVLRQMEIDREGKTSIVILDACRDNPLARNLARSMGTRSTAVGRGLAAAATGLGTFIAYATQPGNVALDGTGRNSPFTSALVRHMSVGGRNLPATMIEVRKDVVAATDGKQVPWDHSALTGDFYFRPGTAVASSAPPATGPGIDVAALQERLKKLEDDANKRTGAGTNPPAAVASPLPPILPKPPAIAPSSMAIDQDVRLDGTIISEARQPNVDACRASCDATRGCAGFQHGKKMPQMGLCQLFDSIAQRQQDTGWRSGVKAGDEMAPGNANTAQLPPELRGLTPDRTETGFHAYEGWVVFGEKIKTSPADSSRSCAIVCRNTPACVGATYHPYNRSCIALKAISEAQIVGIEISVALVRTAPN